ncbi:DUF1552 domain-containing protein [Sorangium sp. So ce1000]|uniref:DUF1552 domain-containing protein n=1 Tax=Sorangium sp. So ce1000 TaxID=3133325 RepID=UPI003F61C1C9
MNPKTAMNLAHPHAAPRRGINRRAFLRAGGVAIALPFLEGLPARSAWAADSPPVFSLYIVAACGVVGKKFFPDQTGPLTTDGLAAMTDKATHVLAPHAPNLLFIRGINFPMGGPTNCGHAQGLCQSLTARPAQGGGSTASSGGVSADVQIAKLVNEGGAEPLTLYAGNRRNGYIAERISFKGAGAGQVRSADDNPYTLYAKLVGLAESGGGSSGGNGGQVADELILSRKSANDFVREELKSLMRMSALSSADKQRLQQHFDAIRDAEVTMGEMASTCSQAGLSTSELDALKSGFAFKTNGMIEDVAKLHLELVALAFACNFNRVATLQHGDGTDGTKYSVPANASLGWPFHHISHRVQSDAATGNNPTAEQAHAEIDVLRMQTLLHGLDHFKSRDLFDKSIIMWTNHVSDGPSHSFRNVPTIIAGSGGGYLKQGAYIDAGDVTNNRLFNGLIAAAVRDKTEWTENFGEGKGSGPIDGMLA